MPYPLKPESPDADQLAATSMPPTSLARTETAAHPTDDGPNPAPTANRPTDVGGASKSLRPSYGRPQAQAPAEGGGGGLVGAPDHRAAVAEGGHDQDPHAASASPTADAAQPRVQRASAAAAARRKPKRRQRDAVRKKQCRVTARFDQDEKQQLVEQAAAARLSLAHLVARRALAPENGTSPVADQLDAAIDELAATRSELSAWGNNLNQIARQLNMGAALPPGPAATLLTAAERLLHRDLPAAVAHLDDTAHLIAKAHGRR